jgi:hypothetical protein
MTIGRHVVVTVTKEGGAVTRQGFGVPAFFNDNSVQSTSARFNRYASTAEIVDAGFTTSDQFYKWAAVAFSQQPAPQYVASAFWDVTGTETIDAAITAVEASNGTDYYHAAIDSRTDSIIILAATTFEALKKYFYAQTSDADLPAGTAGNIGEDLRLASRARTALVYNATDAEFSDGAMCGIGGAAQVDAPGGAITFKFKTLRGVTASTLTTSQLDAIDTEYANHYTVVGGRGILAEGTSADGEFIDVQHTLDWTYFRTQEAVFRALATTSTKVPYTNAGIGAVEAEIRGVLETGIENGHFDPEVEPIIVMPKKADIAAADLTARLLPDIDAQVDIAGAIHKVSCTIRVRV